MGPEPSAELLLFGGSFNPIHIGHLIVARAAAEQLGIARIVLLPSARPPHKERHDLAPAADRLEMCRLATVGDAMFEVSDWEIGQSGPNYTINTVKHFRALRNAIDAKGGSDNSRLFWLIGMDSLRELPSWHRIPELLELCTFVTAGRPGSTPPARTELSTFTDAQYAQLMHFILQTPMIDIRSSEIRARLRRGASIRHLTPDPVREYIRKQGLYADR